jgi:hypothetical protein
MIWQIIELCFGQLASELVTASLRALQLQDPKN